MEYGIDSARMIDCDRVFLDLNNPRHEPFDDQHTIIEYLCHDEQVLPLAKDIVRNGLNPLELFALLPHGEDAYVAAEGNRRLCALKLLNDPDLAPADQRQEFERLSTTWTPVRRLFAVVFDNREDVRLWLDRIHAGFAEGRGRRQWNAEQKSRNSGYSKNNLAQALLDTGEAHDFISASARKGRLSTVQRYVANPLMRNALGIDARDLGNITTDLPESDFNIAFRRFMQDIAQKRITTRDNSPKIGVYANKLRNLPGISGERVVKRPLTATDISSKSRSTHSTKQPRKPTKIPHSDELHDALRAIPSYKLEKLYYSLCSIPLSVHTPLLSIGAWSFVESLTALDGRSPSVDFVSYLSKQKLIALGFRARHETRAVTASLKRLSE